MSSATGGKVTAFQEDSELEAFLARRPGRELFVKVDRYHDEEGSVALLGDSAAGMYSLLGQGCASGLQAAASLDRCLSQNKGDVRAGIRAYSDAAVPEGHAAT